MIVPLIVIMLTVGMLTAFDLPVLVYCQEPTLPDYAISEDISFNPSGPVVVGTSITVSANIHNIGITWVTMQEDGDYVGYNFSVVDTTSLMERIDIDMMLQARDDPVDVTVKIDDLPIWTSTAVVAEGWVDKKPAVDRPIEPGVHTLRACLNFTDIVVEGKLDVDWIRITQKDVAEASYFEAEDYDSSVSNGINDIYPHDAIVGFYDGDPDAGGTLIRNDTTVGDTNYVHDLGKNVYYIRNDGVATASVTWTAYPVGYHDVYVKVDPDNSVSEGDETNNEASGTIGVYAILTIVARAGGTTDPPPGPHIYYGGNPDIAATPDTPDARFVCWQLDGYLYDVSPITTVDMNVSHTLLAIFGFGPYDVAVPDVILKSVVFQGYGFDIDVTVENQGNDTESFSVGLYVATLIDPSSLFDPPNQTQTVTLESGASATITFSFDTTGVPFGNYTVGAGASFLTPPASPGETDTADNFGIGGFVLVVMAGDINGDGVVNILDISTAAKAFGSHSTNPRWNPNADVNNDGFVNILDIATVARNFGKTADYPWLHEY
jgi:hypothetical protein